MEDREMWIYHMCPADAWAAPGTYYPETFADDGCFIHCSPAVNDTLLDIANHFYKSSSGDWIVLTVDTTKLTGEVRWEAPMAVGDRQTKLDSALKMPHIYGTIDREAARVSHRLVRDESDGTFLRIEEVEQCCLN